MARERKWDAVTDFVAIGSGIGGLAGAITARENGLTAVVVEKASLLGGITAYSFGEVWIPGNHMQAAAGIEDSVASGRRYCEWLGMGQADPGLVEAYIDNGPNVLSYFEKRAGVSWRIIEDLPDYYFPLHEDAAAAGRFIESEPFPAGELGQWQELTRTSPHAPYGLTHHDMFSRGGAAGIAEWDFELMGRRLERDERCLGPGLAAAFTKAALDHDVRLLTETSVEELILDGDRVVGLRASREGADFLIRAERGILIAAGGYDWNPDFNLLYEHRLDSVSAVPSSITGDSLKLAGSIGAKLGQVPTTDLLGFHIPGEEQDGQPLWRMSLGETGLPHGIVVNAKGLRFGDESFYPSIGRATQIIDGAAQTQRNLPCWHIIDSQFVEKYPYGSVLPGQGLPEELAFGAENLSELASKIGIDPVGLEAEVAKFNGYARDGCDGAFGRGERPWANRMSGDRNHHPNPNLGAVEKPPFFAIPQARISVSMMSVGIVGDADGRALGYDNSPIDGLYVAGNAMARLDNGAGYQSGMAIGRGMIFGHLAAKHAAGPRPRQPVAR